MSPRQLSLVAPDQPSDTIISDAQLADAACVGDAARPLADAPRSPGSGSRRAMARATFHVSSTTQRSGLALRKALSEENDRSMANMVRLPIKEAIEARQGADPRTKAMKK